MADPVRVSAAEFARRRFLHFAAGTAALPAMARLAWAQAYPTRPITMIVPVRGRRPHGCDRAGRDRADEKVAWAIHHHRKRQRGDGSIGTGRAARARPDGYTIDLGFTGTHVLNGAFYSLPYDVLNDFAPISPLVTTP